MMKRLMFALLAGAAFATPAIAQQAMPEQPPMTNAMRGDTIATSNLSANQIRQVQQALTQKGFSVGAIDGVWGTQTATALYEFQKSQGIVASQVGDTLDHRSIAALGLDVAQFAADPPLNPGAPPSTYGEPEREPGTNPANPNPSGDLPPGMNQPGSPSGNEQDPALTPSR